MKKATTQRAFTLVELMVVVVIIGVLASLALFAFRKFTSAARSAEATQMLGAIRASQEGYFQSFGQYCGDARAPALFPANVPFLEKVQWNPPQDSAFFALGVQSPSAVWFQYYMVAGTAADAPPATAPFLPGEVEGRPWFWAAACGDFNGDADGAQCSPEFANDAERNALSFYELSSLRGDVVIHNEGH